MTNPDLEAVAKKLLWKQWEEAGDRWEDIPEYVKASFREDAKDALLADPVRREVIALLEAAVSEGEGLHLWKPEPQKLLARMRAQTEEG